MHIYTKNKGDMYTHKRQVRSARTHTQKDKIEKCSVYATISEFKGENFSQTKTEAE